jgi:hypothetical protein
MSTHDASVTPALQILGDTDAVTCDPEGDSCALPSATRP